MVRRRLDKEMVRRGRAEDLDHAARLIGARRVIVAGTTAMGTARMTAADESIHVLDEPEQYVGRGGKKLAAALTGFAIDASAKVALDLGASTGGFTDALLQFGAARVISVDVGRGQLHQRLVSDPRVDNLERTDLRDLDPAVVGRFELVTVDLSFISIRHVAAHLVGLTAPGGDLVLLVKPQFESERHEADAGRGVITDPAIWTRTLTEVMNTLVDHGAARMGLMVSPIRGAEGNVEFLLWTRTGGVDHEIDVAAVVVGL